MSSAHPSCDAANAQALVAWRRTERPSLVLATCILASSLSFVDGSVVNVALPLIARDLAAETAGTQWIINAYLLPLGVLLLVGGAAGDRFGRRRFLIAGTCVFAVASLICSLASGLGGLLAGRVAQGVGAAMLMPNSLAILGESFEGEAKGRAVGIWAASGAAMGAFGPVLGGWLADSIGWRAIFLLNLPLAIGSVALASAFVPRDGDGGEQRIDLPGAALATLSLASGSWALTVGAGPSGWTRGAFLMILMSIGALGVFLYVERRRGDDAMMPPLLFASPTFVGLTILTVLLYGALGVLFVLLPYVLISVADYSGAAAGAALVPLPMVLAITSPTMGRLAERIGSRWMLSIGPACVAIGFVLLCRIDVSASYLGQVLPAMLVLALGLSGAVAPLTTAVLGAVDVRHVGSASGFNSAAARVGGLIATALIGSVLAARGEALVASFHAASLVCAGACTLAGGAALFMIRSPAKS